jgi:hypothetical protein
MKTLITVFLLSFALSVPGCSVIQETSCEQIAGALHDASLFVCTMIKGETIGEAKLRRAESLDKMLAAYIDLVNAYPEESLEKVRVISRLYAARALVKEQENSK